VLDTALLIAGYASIPLVLLSVFAMARTIGRLRPLVTSGLVWQIVFSVAFLLLYRLLLDIGEPTILSWGLFGVGLLGGALQGFTTRLVVAGSRVAARRSIVYLIVWGLSFSATQLLSMLGQGSAAAYGMSSVYMATGIAAAMNGTLLARRLLVSAGSVSAQPRSSIQCPNCGASNDIGRLFCNRCGIAFAPVPGEASIGKRVVSCSACGQMAATDQRFCNGCGRVLR
jgi:hypothetical protein